MTDELGLLNSYDNWHGKFGMVNCGKLCICNVLLVCVSLSILYMYIPGTNNVAKGLQKISQGANKWEGVNWFQQLSDKCQPTCL